MKRQPSTGREGEEGNRLAGMARLYSPVIVLAIWVLVDVACEWDTVVAVLGVAAVLIAVAVHAREEVRRYG